MREFPTPREFGVYEEIALMEKIKELDLEFDQGSSDVNPWDSQYAYKASFAKGGNIVEVHLFELANTDTGVVTDQASITILHPGEVATKSSPTEEFSLVIDRKVSLETGEDSSVQELRPDDVLIIVDVPTEPLPNRATYEFRPNVHDDILIGYPALPVDPKTGRLKPIDSEFRRAHTAYNEKRQARENEAKLRGERTFTRERYNMLMSLLGSLGLDDKLY